MKALFAAAFSCLFFLLVCKGAFAEGLKRPVEHELVIDLKPHLGVLSAEDTLTFYPGKWEHPSFVFLLHGGFEVEPVEIPHQGEWKIVTAKTTHYATPQNRIEIFKPEGKDWPDFVQLKFRYSGPYLDLQANEKEKTTETAHTVFLGEGSLFYPAIETSEPDPLIIFEMQTTTPPAWKVVSEGKRISHIDNGGRISTLWKCDDPMEEIHLIADRYQEYQDRWEDINLMVFLRKDDPELARRYLETAKLYIPFYQRLIGTYPFVKFAVVENSEQTGYGMPSFTLLGSRVIRFPFILHTSYPHEILHNWWGNGAYVQPGSGNWSEGITTYLADHLFPDLQGKGDRYRFQELMKYKNYVTPENDFPLSEFQSRTDMATQAIGYGKLVLVLHMLRNQVGGKVFLDALHDFYFENLFKRAGFDELKKAMEAHSRQNLSGFFKQWISSSGAPQIELGTVSTSNPGEKYQLDFEILQIQESRPFEINVPFVVWLEGADSPLFGSVPIKKSVNKFSIPLREPPRAILLDPYNEVFRLLNNGEVPPSVSMTYGDNKTNIIISDPEHIHLNKAYLEFVKTVNGNVRSANNTWSELSGNSVWLLGHNSKLASEILEWLDAQGVVVRKNEIRLEGKNYSLKNHSVVLTLPHPGSPEHSITWVMLHSAGAVKGLARKLPHYGKYGYLVFKGEKPTNIAKGTWPANPTGRFKRFSEGPIPLPPQKPLVNFRPGDPLE